MKKPITNLAKRVKLSFGKWVDTTKLDDGEYRQALTYGIEEMLRHKQLVMNRIKSTKP